MSNYRYCSICLIKGGADDASFQDFIRDGGPEVPNKQYLTVDYLWNFFLGNRKELGVDNEIKYIAAFYKQTRDRAFQNQTDDATELRILKAVLLFCLLDKLAPGGHDRLKPTVENIELSFKGDGTIADPVGIVEQLEKKHHCFSVTNGNISLFTISTVKPEDIEKYRDKFHDLLHEKVEAKIEEHTKNYRKYSSGRFNIRVSDASHTTLTNINQATRDRYTEKINKDDGSVCLWFVVAKDHDEQLQIPQKIDSILQQLNDHRILMFTFPQLSFCHSNKNLWGEYMAELQLESDAALLIVDAMGAEYMPLLLAMAKRRGMSIESQAVVTAKLPTETIFNPIQWDEARILPGIKSIDNIVHNGAVKCEVSVPERNFVETLRVFETEIMNRIDDGFKHSARVVVTADHGASRLAVIAHNERKGTTLPWEGQPDNWRYSLAPQGVTRPPELEQEYFPETKKTYWIVRGYNRLPKMGGKLYELHGGATPEERLVPVVVFRKNAVTEVPKQLGKKTTAEVVDEFEGLI